MSETAPHVAFADGCVMGRTPETKSGRRGLGEGQEGATATSRGKDEEEETAVELR